MKKYKNKEEEIYYQKKVLPFYKKYVNLPRFSSGYPKAKRQAWIDWSEEEIDEKVFITKYDWLPDYHEAQKERFRYLKNAYALYERKNLSSFYKEKDVERYQKYEAFKDDSKVLLWLYQKALRSNALFKEKEEMKDYNFQIFQKILEILFEHCKNQLSLVK